MTTNTIDLEQEYRSVRQALIRAGLMIGSIDALHADWQRWVNDSKSAGGPPSCGMGCQSMVGSPPVPIPVLDGSSAPDGARSA